MSYGRCMLCNKVSENVRIMKGDEAENWMALAAEREKELKLWPILSGIAGLCIGAVAGMFVKFARKRGGQQKEGAPGSAPGTPCVLNDTTTSPLSTTKAVAKYQEVDGAQTSPFERALSGKSSSPSPHNSFCAKHGTLASKNSFLGQMQRPAPSGPKPGTGSPEKRTLVTDV